MNLRADASNCESRRHFTMHANKEDELPCSKHHLASGAAGAGRPLSVGICTLATGATALTQVTDGAGEQGPAPAHLTSSIRLTGRGRPGLLDLNRSLQLSRVIPREFCNRPGSGGGCSIRLITMLVLVLLVLVLGLLLLLLFLTLLRVLAARGGGQGD